MGRVLEGKPRVIATLVSTVADLAMICLLATFGQAAHPMPSKTSGTSNPTSFACAPSGTLADGNPLVPYHATLTCSGGTPPYTRRLLSGSLPPGLTLNQHTGLISGIPSEATQASFTAQVADSSSPTPQTVQIDLTLNIVTLGPSDPELPQVFIDTTFPDTSGYIGKTVCASGCDYVTVQAALNGVHQQGGDTKGRSSNWLRE